MKKSISNFLIFSIILAVTGCSNDEGKVSEKSVEKPKNIIIFIGDGMGVSHLYAGMTKSSAPFYLEKFPYSGLSKTYSADSYITDSGAGGTAIGCGEKTNNGMIGVRPDSSLLISITELAHKNGLAAGVVSTSSVTHATPASFVAHNAGRGNYEEIANDFVKGTVDVIIGGGEDHFRKRKDGKDLTTELKNQGFDVVYTFEDMKKSGGKKLAAFLAKEHMPKASEGRQGMLAEMTKKAIETLSSNKNGFVLMVEGSMIDWGAHEKNIDYVISETIDFDKAIGAAYEYASLNKNTLILVTADHETGGLVLTGGDMKNKTVEGTFTSSDHSAVMVPVFSYGPGADRFSGIHENTFFYKEFVQMLGLTNK